VLSASGLTISHGSRTLFADVSVQLRPGQRNALVGGNGKGKTTLIEILVGINPPDEGAVHRPNDMTIGYLPQELTDHPTGSVLAEVRAGAERIVGLEAELERLLSEMGSAVGDEQAKLIDDYGDAQHAFEGLGGYELDARVRQVLSGLGFRETDMDRPFTDLSGGWRMRAALARLLIASPDVLVLDEPTNHLDTDSVAWLEAQLKAFPGAILFVSHDRDFIDNIATRVLELAGGALAAYDGGFAEFVVQREERIAQIEAAAAQQSREVARVEQFVERFRYKATKARQVQSRLKTLEKLDRIQAPARAELVARYSFPEPQRSARTVVEIRDADVGYDDTIVLADVDLVVERGHKLALVGPNGAGKSTLLKMIVGELAPLRGTATIGANVDIAHFAQHQVEALPMDRTVLQAFQGAAGPQTGNRNLRSVLGSFGFSGDAVDTRVEDLSGGERTRLAIAICLVNPVNLLILDEPTNHLDLPSCDVLEDALTAYPGTILLVSHDRHLIRAVADDLLEVRDGRVQLHSGVDEAVLSPSFEGGTAGTGTKPAAGPKLSTTEPKSSTTTPKPSMTAGDKAARKRADAETRTARHAGTKELRKAVARAERAMTASEAEVAELNRQLADPATYSDPGRSTELATAFGEAKDRAASTMDAWMAAAEDLERAGG